MSRVFAAILVLALATCFGRVSAWASTPGDAHACCRGESSAPVKGPVISECCAIPALGGAVSVVRAELPSILVETPAPRYITTVRVVLAEKAAPPGLLAVRSSVPARAPPLA